MTTSITGVAVARDGMYATDDGGEVWRLVNPPGVRVSNTAVMGASHGEAWVIQPARSLSTLVVWVSPNLGRSWQSSQLPTGLTGDGGPLIVRSVYFLNAQQGWLLVQPPPTMNSEPGVLFTTTDGGRRWTLTASSAPSASGRLPFAGQVAFATPTTGWLVGSVTSTSPSLLAVTHDGGHTWHLESLPGAGVDKTVLQAPTVLGAHVLLPVLAPGTGAVTAMRFFLYASSNDGRTWDQPKGVADAPVAVADVVSASTAYTWTGYQFNSYAGTPVLGALLVTEDGGAHWTRLGPSGVLHKLMGEGVSIQVLDFVSPTAGWAITARLDTDEAGPLLYTDDGGRTWRVVVPRLQP